MIDLSTNYKNALQEVYIILQNLKETEYEKLPSDLLDIIKINRNEEYNFNINTTIVSKDQKLLLETREILFYIYKNYLCKSWEKEKILKWEKEKEIEEEMQKKKNYSGDLFYENKKQNKQITKNNKNESNELIKYNNNIFKKITKFFNKLFNKLF